MIDAGADANAQGENYGTALQKVSGYRNVTDIMQLLLDAGADVNARGGGYGSPLDIAIDLNWQPTISLLLANGAKTTAELESECEGSSHSRSNQEGLGSEEKSHSKEHSTLNANASPPPAESAENSPMAAL